MLFEGHCNPSGSEDLGTQSMKNIDQEIGIGAASRD